MSFLVHLILTLTYTTCLPKEKQAGGRLKSDQRSHFPLPLSSEPKQMSYELNLGDAQELDDYKEL